MARPARNPVMSILLLFAAGACGAPESGPAPPVVTEVTTGASDSEATPPEKPPGLRQRLLAEWMARSVGGGGTDASDRDSDAVRAAAGELLDRLAPDRKERVPLLLELSHAASEDPLRRAVRPARELEAMGLSSVPVLLDLVRGPPSELRSHAICELAHMVGAAARIVPVLLPVARNEEDSDRHVALKVLVELAPDTPGLRDLLGPAGECSLLLCYLGRDLVAEARRRPDLPEWISRELRSEASRASMLWDLQDADSIPGELAPDLVACLHAASEDDRIRAAFALAKADPGAPELPEALVPALADRRDGSRARDVLIELGPHARSAAPALVRLLEGNDTRAAARAAEVLGRVDAPEVAVPALLRILDVPDPVPDLPDDDRALDELLAAAAEALIRYPEAADAAVEVLVRQLPRSLLLYEKKSGLRTGRGRRKKGRAWAVEALGRLGPRAERAVPVLSDALGYDWPCDDTAAEALVRIGGAGDDALATALRDRNAGVRCAAAYGLARAGSDGFLRELRLALADEDPVFAAYALAALARRDPTGPDVIAAARSFFPEVSEDGGTLFCEYDGELVLIAARSAGPRARPILEAGLEARSKEVQDLARILLAENGVVVRDLAPATARRLASPYYDYYDELDPIVRSVFDRLDPRLAAEVVRQVGHGLRGKKDGIYDTLEVLTGLGPAAAPAVPGLIELLGDPCWQCSAIEVLGAIGPGAGAAVPELRALTGAWDKDARRAARSALLRITGE